MLQDFPCAENQLAFADVYGQVPLSSPLRNITLDVLPASRSQNFDIVGEEKAIRI